MQPPGKRLVHFWKTFLVVNFLGQDASQVPQVVLVHQHDVVKRVEVAGGHLSSRFPADIDFVFGKNLSRWRIDGVSDFLGACRCAFDEEFVLPTGFLDEPFHDKFRNRAAADISVADEENFSHWQLFPHNAGGTRRPSNAKFGFHLRFRLAARTRNVHQHRSISQRTLSAFQ